MGLVASDTPSLQGGPDGTTSSGITASAWHLDAGAVPEAIRHSTEARDFGRASDLTAEYWAPVANAGQLPTIISWIDALPKDVVTNDARLCVAAAMVSSELGRAAASDRWLEAAERAPLPRPIMDGLSSIESGVAMIHGIRLPTSCSS